MCTDQNTSFLTCCLLQRGQGAPAREPVVSEEEQKQMMMHYYRRQEELKVRHLYKVFCFLLFEQCAFQLKTWLKFSLNVVFFIRLNTVLRPGFCFYFAEAEWNRWWFLFAIRVVRPTGLKETISRTFKYQMGPQINRSYWLYKRQFCKYWCLFCLPGVDEIFQILSSF